MVRRRWASSCWKLRCSSPRWWPFTSDSRHLGSSCLGQQLPGADWGLPHSQRACFANGYCGGLVVCAYNWQGWPPFYSPVVRWAGAHLKAQLSGIVMFMGLACSTWPPPLSLPTHTHTSLQWYFNFWLLFEYRSCYVIFSRKNSKLTARKATLISLAIIHIHIQIHILPLKLNITLLLDKDAFGVNKEAKDILIRIRVVI